LCHSVLTVVAALDLAVLALLDFISALVLAVPVVAVAVQAQIQVQELQAAAEVVV
jgi:hypothetical protein